jgi:hypothetical protein
VGVWSVIYFPRGWSSLWTRTVRDPIAHNQNLWSKLGDRWARNSWELSPFLFKNIIGSTVIPPHWTKLPLLCAFLKCRYLLIPTSSPLEKIPVSVTDDWLHDCSVILTKEWDVICVMYPEFRTKQSLSATDSGRNRAVCCKIAKIVKRAVTKCSQIILLSPGKLDRHDSKLYLWHRVCSTRTEWDIFFHSTHIFGFGRANPWNIVGSIWNSFLICRLTFSDGRMLESYQMGTYVRTHYHKFPLNRVSLQAGNAYQVTLEYQW